MNRGLLIIVSGPAGVGKGTILNEVFKRDKNLVYSVSCTTRPPRPGESDGVNYYFMTPEQFKEKIDNNKMLEYAVYCENYYGTSLEYVERERNEGKDVVLEIEIQGALQVMKKYDDCVSVFIAPPSFEILKNRLIGRGTESDDVIHKRLKRAREELLYKENYKYVVINEFVDKAVDEILAILESERRKVR